MTDTAIEASGQVVGDSYGFELLDLSPSIGTEVHGIDLTFEHSQEVIDYLSSLLVERKVIFFRDQSITMEQHIAFARRFGEVEIHPFTANDTKNPEVIHLDNDRERPPAINVWHSDVTWRESPSLGSILRARKIPKVGGDTLFANMEAAYNGLDDATKKQIEDMYAVHDNEPFLNGMRSNGVPEAQVEALRQQYPPVRHPVVRTHPVSQRKSLYVNRIFTRYIEGLPESESNKLLEKLYLSAWIPDYQCRFRWQKDSLTFWDNRSVQHYAAADYWPETRKMERVTIIGERPY